MYFFALYTFLAFYVKEKKKSKEKKITYIDAFKINAYLK